MKQRAAVEQIRIAPEINVIKIGGHGAIDYGREVMHPLCEEIGQLSKKHQLLVVTGGGGRVRHIMDIGMDLGMPTGVLAELPQRYPNRTRSWSRSCSRGTTARGSIPVTSSNSRCS